MFKTIIFTLLGALTLSVSAETTNARAVVTDRDGKSREIYVITASEKAILYLANARSTSQETMLRRSVDSIFFYRPSSYQKALEAYNSGKFSVAAAGFKACKEEYIKTKLLPQNYSSRAAFYELECARRQGKYDELATLLDEFRPDSLVNENYITQLEIYPFWEAVGKKQWKRIKQISPSWDKKKLPGFQRAQVAYCVGLALKEMGELDEALMRFNEALALSELKEIELVQNSAEMAIEVILADEAVQACEKSQSTSKPDQGSRAYLNLLEAVAIAKFWDGCESGRPLPTKYKKLLKYERKQ